MPAFRGVRAAAVALVLAASAGVTLASPAAADPPVVQDDHKWMYPNQGRSIDVLANDSDPDGDELAVCRVEEPPRDADYFVETDGDQIFVYSSEDTGEDIVIDYYVCDFETLVPATLTISFREIHPIKIAKLDRPGRLRVTNDNKRVVRFLYGSFSQDRPDGRTRVPAHDSVRHPGASSQDRLDRHPRSQRVPRLRHRARDRAAPRQSERPREGHPHTRRGQALGQTALTGQPVTSCLRP